MLTGNKGGQSQAHLQTGRNLIVHDMKYHLFAEPEKAKLKKLAPEQVVY